MSLETIDFERLDLKAGDRILDLGCGEGRHAISAYLLAPIEVFAVDLSARDLATAQQRLQEFEQAPESSSHHCTFIRASGLKLPFADNTFDKVICAEVLEHIPNYQAMLLEVRRVLKPGGIFAASVPRYFPEWICWKLSDAYHEVEGGHVRIFASGELRRAIESLRMRRFARHWAHSLHVPYWWLRCLFWEQGEDAAAVRTYHRFLVWDLMKKPVLTAWLDRLLNPLMGKSVVMYFVNEIQMDQASLQRTAQYIAELQLPSGALPWFNGGIIDPWDHVEAIMGLTIGGHYAAARHGFDWLADTQKSDGSWLAAYEDEEPADDTRAETNFVAYPATGLWHYWTVTGDLKAVEEYWPMIERAMLFVIDLQTPEGEIYWAVDPVKGISRDALITGCSSIYKSLQCTAALATLLQQDPEPWLTSRQRLGHAIRTKPHLFDRTWPTKQRYSMDWFYPVLTGVIQGDAATARLAQRWDTFVEPHLGCRCVEEEPWVTVAETCELIMACLSANKRAAAEALYNSIQRFQIEDGSWWTGYVFTDDVHWPDERPSWTAAAVLLAADALFSITPAHNLFKDHSA